MIRTSITGAAVLIGFLSLQVAGQPMQTKLLGRASHRIPTCSITAEGYPVTELKPFIAVSPPMDSCLRSELNDELYEWRLAVAAVTTLDQERSEIYREQMVSYLDRMRDERWNLTNPYLARRVILDCRQYRRRIVEYLEKID